MNERQSGRERAGGGQHGRRERPYGHLTTKRGAGERPADGHSVGAKRSHPPGTDLRRADAGGTRLRIRALHAMGHCAARIARAAGTREQVVQKLVRGSTATVSQDLREAIVSVYEAWWDKRPPETTHAEKAAAAAARRRAARGNWCAGAGLDDDLLDQPGYRPDCGWKPALGTGVAGSDDPVPGIKRSQVSCDHRNTAGHSRPRATDAGRRYGEQPDLHTNAGRARRA